MIAELPDLATNLSSDLEKIPGTARQTARSGIGLRRADGIPILASWDSGADLFRAKRREVIRAEGPAARKSGKDVPTKFT